MIFLIFEDLRLCSLFHVLPLDVSYDALDSICEGKSSRHSLPLCPVNVVVTPMSIKMMLFCFDFVILSICTFVPGSNEVNIAVNDLWELGRQTI